MKIMAGRNTDSRTVTLTLTNASTAVTAAAGTFTSDDVGRTVTRAGNVPTGATVASVQSDTAATLSAAATASGAKSVTLGALGDKLGFVGFVPEGVTQASSWTVAGVTSGTPSDVLTDDRTQVAQPVAPY
jgi:hypothetical protein